MEYSNNNFKEVNNKNRKISKIGIGVLGYGFMGKLHSTGYIKIPFQTEWAPAYPFLVAVCGRSESKVKEMAIRYGYKGYYTDWKDLIRDKRIQIFDNCGPDNIHYQPTIAAAEEGKHVICEKPLSMSIEESKSMLDVVNKTKVKNMCSFNYRFIPAVRLACELMKKELIGKIYSFRGYYLQDVGRNPSEPLDNVWYASGSKSGVLLGIGCHIIDLARVLVGEVKSVLGISKTFNTTRLNFKGTKERINADEENMAILEFKNGAIGTITASGISSGRKNFLSWEINGSLGSLIFNLEDLNHLQVYLEKKSLKEVRGFSNVSVTESIHPYFKMAWAPGHSIGWESSHFYQLFHFVDAVVNNKPVGPLGATFYDGFRVQLVMEAIKESSRKDKKVEISSLY